jgi:SAM-dependent methyltransferase
MNDQSQDSVRRLFTDSSADYASLFDLERRGVNWCFRRRLELAVEMTQGLNGYLLDAACGPGQITAAVFRSGGFQQAALVDISPAMIERAKENFPALPGSSGERAVCFHLQSIFDPLPADFPRFNLILVLGLIAHTGRLDELLGILADALQPSGRILLQSTLLDHVGTKMVRMATKKRHLRKFGYQSNYYSEADIREAAIRRGFIVEAIRRFGVGFPWGDKICAAANYHLENIGRNWASKHGSEGLFMLRFDG